MAKQLKPDSITQPDLIEYLDGYSDFSFEIKTLRALVTLGFTCEHGGTYDDPATGKPREYDIRATRRMGKAFLRLAVECKNLRANFPLLVSCLPRRAEEAFHEVSYSYDPAKSRVIVSAGPTPLAMTPHSKSVRLEGSESLYSVGAPVGKSCDQVGRLQRGDAIESGDSDVYAKWSQALSSADELTYLACSDGADRTGSCAVSIVLPLLVVPDGRLWETHYDANGNRSSDPRLVDRCSYFVNRKYYHRSPAGGDKLVISHLEFVTSNGLLKFLDDLCGDEAKIAALFPIEQIEKRVRGT
ncbi:MAG: hypothetical protein IID37_05220 [Planctomycetes bacterium]|nr:hypothetical protein [Planctomycetota bacterium]